MIAMGEHKERSQKIIDATYTVAARNFAQPIYDKALAVGMVKKDFPRFLLLLRSFVATVGAKKVVQITEATERQIRGAITEAIAEGEGTAGAAALITARARIIPPLRAAVIARTETHSAAMWSQVEAIKDTGLVLRKQWVATQDARTRTGEDGPFDHANMNGVTVGPDELFDVDGDMLEFPGDPNGDPANIINCRCVLNFVE
jgi:uncharacterized protein with gpF-like domain